MLASISRLSPELNCILRPKKWLSLEVWRNVIALTLSITVTALGNHPVMAYWILHTLSIVVLLAWTELMLLIGKLPSLGYYALMFTTVLNNVLKVFGAFICLIIGYALCFSIQFYNFEEFRNPLRALVKTMVMMMGEFEYGDLFSDETIAPARIDLTSRLVFLIFVIVTSIVLMNLLVGLAVSDVQELQKVSHAKKMEKQAEFLIHMEKGIAKYLQLPCKFLPFKQYIIRRNAISTLFEFVDNAKFRRSKILSSRLIDNIKVVAKKQKGKWKPEITSESTLSVNIET